MNVENYDLDISTCSSIPSADFVIHAAAAVSIAEYQNNPDEEYRNILAGTTNFCEIAKRTHRASKIVYVSSGAVYGKTPGMVVRIPEDYPLAANGLLDKRNVYAMAKQQAEREIKRLGQSGLGVSVARCFTFIGKYLPMGSGFALSSFIEDGIKKRPIQVNARHNVYRSYMHTDDLVRWLLTIAENADSRCPVYNVGSEDAIEIGELAKKVASHFGQKVVLNTERSGAIDSYVPDTEFARRTLSLGINIRLDEALESTIKEMIDADVVKD